MSKPILFSAEMVRAILAGRKTQTRRIMKPQRGGHIGHFRRCPYGMPGDTLWVKEGYQIAGAISGSTIVYGHYLADGTEFNATLKPQEFAKWKARKFPCRASPGMFMYKSLTRIKLPVVSVRVERVRSINGEDAQEEGVSHPAYADPTRPCPSGAKGAFSELWDSIHGRGAWERNDWVWVIEFERSTNE